MKMLTKEDYRKIIETALIKKGFVTKCSDYSGMKSSLPNKVKAQLNKFSKSIRNLDHEKGILIDEKGNIVAENDNGEQYSVKIGVSNISDNQELLHSGMKFHIEHNHPGPFQGDELDNPLPTCLSRADMLGTLTTQDYEKFYVDDDGHPHWTFIVGSITADCSNGSRMTLAIKDEKKLHTTCEKSMNRYGDMNRIYNNACAKLEEGYFKTVQTASAKIEEDMSKWIENNASPNEDITTFLKRASEQRLKLSKKYYTENLPKLLEKNIKEFNKMGIELTVGWVK